MDHPLVLFDGVCVFCNRSVNFIIAHDPAARFRFAPLQSPLGQSMLARCGLQQAGIDSVVLIEGGRCYRKSTAALRIAHRLTGWWPWTFFLVMVPAQLRDLVYDWFARHRYRWFGQLKMCLMPTPEVRQRFLDTELP
jgi:predicted DCC family thiol-disulfide oxidoreductase YuxK